MRYVIWLIAVVCGALAAIGTAQAEKRVALVVGNASYGHHAGLPNVPNDAAAIAALFRAAKFDSVEARANLGVAELRRVLREFSRQAAGADVAVLFFAGHGVEVDRTNYLIPVDARLASDLDVEDETVSLDRVLQLLEPAKRLRLVILDACRDSPFAAGMKRTGATRSVGRGLGRSEPGISNTLIAYATKANAVAEDGRGANSPYTAALVKHLTAPGLDLRIALGHVRDEVLASTGNKQEPYFTGSLGGGTLSLVGPAQPSSQPQPSAAALEWARVDKTSVAELETFRRRHPASAEAEYALARIDELRKAEQGKKQEEKKVAVVTPPPPPPPDPALTPGRTFRDCAECPEMVVVPAGSFMMGSSPTEIAALVKENNGDGYRREAPQHRVAIARPFAVGKFEVTFAEWDACVAAGGCMHRPDDAGWGRGRRPAINVSWDNVTKEYLPWLSRKTGRTYRLLTEAEWEYAARGVTTASSPGKRHWWGDNASHEYANYGNGLEGCCGGGNPVQAGRDQWANTAPVGQFPANPFGLYDMHGNVWEWVQDCWNESYSGAPSDGSAWTAGNCGQRVLRGGSWGSHPRGLRSAKRTWNEPVHGGTDYGFRVARAIPGTWE